MSDRATPGTARERPPGASDNGPGRAESGTFADAEMVEVALLLPGGRAAALERVARRQGLTLGQLIRRLIRDYLAGDDRLPGGFVTGREPDNSQAGRRT